MTSASGIKSAVSVAWVLSGVSTVMISDDYAGGYERMAGRSFHGWITGRLWWATRGNCLATRQNIGLVDYSRRPAGFCEFGCSHDSGFD